MRTREEQAYQAALAPYCDSSSEGESLVRHEDSHPRFISARHIVELPRAVTPMSTSYVQPKEEHRGCLRRGNGDHIHNATISPLTKLT